MTKTIDGFRGEYRFLSNFHLVTILYEDITYPSSEHAFQAAKSLDNLERLRISRLQTPNLAKKAGHSIVIRGDWNKIRIPTMLDINRIKYQNPVLKKLLLDTGEAELIEGNWWKDTFWGVCNGIGENNLGKILMQIREELRQKG